MDSEAFVDGCNLMPGALRDAGVVAALGAADAGDIPISITDKRRDMTTGVLAYGEMCDASQDIRKGVAPILDGSRFMVALGGCCGILCGIFGALRDRFGRPGLAFIDGHLDFYSGTTTPAGSAADINLWVLTGFGPPGLSDVGGPPPMVQATDTWVMGFRDYEESLTMKSPDPLALIPKAHFVDGPQVQARGASAVGGEAAQALAASPGRFWIHVDLDVLSSQEMPAVDYWLPGGLSWDELRDLLRPLVASPACVGLDVAIYNPSLDPRRKYAPRIVRLLAEALGKG